MAYENSSHTAMSYRTNIAWIKRPAAILLSALSITYWTPANATDSLCEAVATRSAPKTEMLDSLKRGDVVGAITQYKISKSDGATSFCSHGGSCYSSGPLKLTNCSVDKQNLIDDDKDETVYGMKLMRSKVAPEVLRQNDVELRLLDLGLCAACADNAAAFYVKMPASRCASLVKGALERNPDAVSQLKQTPDFCTQ